MDLITSIMNLNSLFNHILKEKENLRLWKEFGVITSELHSTKGVHFIPYAYGLHEITEGPAFHTLKLQIQQLKKEQAKQVQEGQFEKALAAFEKTHRLEKLLDREAARVHLKTNDYFHLSGNDIGFCFTGDRVIDYLILHYSPISKGMYYL